MFLEDKISQDYVQAMKDRDSLKSSVLSFLRAQVKNVKIDKRVEQISNEDIIAVIKKQIKQRQDSITQFRVGSREDLAAKEEQEMTLLKTYLPAQMSPDVLQGIVDEVIRSAGAVSVKDMGRIMKEVMAKAAGSADNQSVSAMVKARLSN